MCADFCGGGFEGVAVGVVEAVRKEKGRDGVSYLMFKCFEGVERANVSKRNLEKHWGNRL